jgi:hypothetical protein
MNDKPRESDWKLYSRLVPEWRERYLQKRNDTFVANLNDPEKAPTDRFWDVLEEVNDQGAIPKFDMAERPSLLRLEYEHPNERRKDS